MSRFLAALLLALAPAIALGADLKLIGEAREHKFATVESDVAGPWMVLGPNAAVVLESKTLGGMPVLGAPRINKADLRVAEGGKRADFVGAPGWYAVIQWPAEDAEASVLVVEMLPAGPRPPPVDPDKPPPVDPDKPPPRPPATSATYVYEKDDTVPPTPVVVAFDKINREKKIIADFFDDDTTDGTGQTPQRYKAAVAAARAAGLPALVLLNGDVVVRVVKNPKTEVEVLEAIK